MKMKNFWKRFWTMNVHNHEGFTLVELIIVIAILAILSSVAVVGYSSYITKANKQADMTLVAEVANALTLAYYSSNSTTGGYVIILRDGVVLPVGEEQADAFGAAAMEAAYGANWHEVLKLKYQWNADISGAAISNVAPDQILGTANSLAGLASAVVGGQVDNSVATSTIANLLGDVDPAKKAEIEAELQKYEGDPNYSTIASNLMIKYLSEDLGNMTVNEDGTTSQISSTSNLALTYAMLYSMANSDDPYADAAQNKLDSFDKAMAEIAEKEKNDPNGTSVTADLWSALADLMADDTLTDSSGNHVSFGSVYDAYAATNGEEDLKGIIDAMGFVNSMAQDYNDAASLSNPDLFNSQAVQNALIDYQNANKYGVVVRIDEYGMITVLPIGANPAA